MDGKSLLPILKGHKLDEWRDSIYYHYYHNGAYNLPKIEAARSDRYKFCLLYTSPSPRDGLLSRMPSSA